MFNSSKKYTIKFLENLVLKILFLMGINKELIQFIGLKKTLILYLAPGNLANAQKFLLSLPQSSSDFLSKVDLKANDLVLDIGANVGDISNYFLSRGCYVEAYEPNPYCNLFLKKRFKNNSKIKVCEAAVSNFDGTGSFFVTVNSHSSSSLINRNDITRVIKQFKTDEITTKIIDIKSIINNMPSKVKLIKIDIEGGEYDLLDELIKPEIISKFEFCAVEVHYKKIPELKARHDKIQSIISLEGWGKKFFLDWH